VSRIWWLFYDTTNVYEVQQKYWKGVEIRMLAQWEVSFFGKMRAYKIKSLDLAKELGWHPGYLSMVLNGKRTPKGAEEKLSAALDSLIAKKAGASQ
jgi:hypothetical protein